MLLESLASIFFAFKASNSSVKSKANVISQGEYNVSLDGGSLYKSVVIIPIIIIIIG